MGGNIRETLDPGEFLGPHDPEAAARANLERDLESGGRVADAINKQPYDISEQAERARGRADTQYSGAQDRQKEALDASARQRQRLEDTAQGKGPSLAGAQLKSASDRSLAQQLAAAASQRGGSAAATQRQLARNQAEAGQVLGQQAAEMGMQERLAATQQLGAQLGQERQAADQLTNQYLQMGFSIDQAEAAAQQQLEQLRSQARIGQMQQSAASRTAQEGQDKGLIGGVIGGVASMFSDKEKKKDIKSGDKGVKSFLDALSAKEYQYKNPDEEGAAKGDRAGILAQDLEKSAMGKTLVKDTPQGKMVDASQGFGAVLAAQAHLNGRLNEIENNARKMKSRRKKNG